MSLMSHMVQENTTTPTNFNDSETKYVEPKPIEIEYKYQTGHLVEYQTGRLIPAEELQTSIPRIASFEKVSYEQFKKDLIDKIKMFKGKDEVIREIYDSIKLPKRATEYSAGYDFFSPFPFKPQPDAGLVVPTGIRCKIEPGWVLKLYPRSGQGFKYGLHLYNSTGIIDGKK